MKAGILFLGDIVGKAGRRALDEMLPGLKRRLEPDIVIANGENAAAGLGVTKSTLREIFSAGVDVVTTGNHVWSKKEGIEALGRDPRILRPLNFPARTPGRGAGIFEGKGGMRIGVMNLQGKVFMDSYQVERSPFDTAEAELERFGAETRIVVADIHAEATSEKQAFAWYLSGRVSAVIGTHTHVQTADETILPRGTAYITDVGMTGALGSVIGWDKKSVIERFLSGMPRRFTVPRRAGLILSAIFVSADARTGRAEAVERIQEVRQ